MNADEAGALVLLCVFALWGAWGYVNGYHEGDA